MSIGISELAFKTLFIIRTVATLILRSSVNVIVGLYSKQFVENSSQNSSHYFGTSSMSDLVVKIFLLNWKPYAFAR